MGSHGQRFRRKALRRGYKVEEVDAFIDRIEATLAGRPIGAPVTAQEVHDVVFRVRFGGYDEWQVDLHLDRAERQIAELEERGTLGRAEPRTPEPVSPPERMGPPERMPSFPRDDHGPAMGPGPAMSPPMPPRPMPAQARPPHDPYGYDDHTGSLTGGFDAPRRGYDGTHGFGAPPVPAGHAPTGRGGPTGPGGYGGDSFDGFRGRHGRADMTTELQMPNRDAYSAPGGPVRGGPPMNAPRPGGPPVAGAPTGSSPLAGSPLGGPPPSGPPMGAAAADLQFVDQMRRGFQVRRFGSGYNPDQVDRLFDEILAAMAGRGPMPVNPADLDATRFDLVSGGYYEEDVDEALRRVKDILHRR